MLLGSLCLPMRSLGSRQKVANTSRVGNLGHPPPSSGVAPTGSLRVPPAHVASCLAASPFRVPSAIPGPRVRVRPGCFISRSFGTLLMWGVWLGRHTC